MGKVIVITGGGSGLGRALARGFAGDGDKVCVLGRTLTKLEKVAGELGNTAVPVQCDIGSPASVEAAFAQIAGQNAKIDVLINNAAKIDYSTLAEASDAHIVDTINTNLLGTLLCTRAATAMMERGGHVINVTSVSVDEPYPLHVVYQATKGGVETMSKHLQDEVRARGIRITVVRAGPMTDEDHIVQSDPEAAGKFFQASLDRGIDLTKIPVSHFSSIVGVFRFLVDTPADVHVETIRFNSRLP